jgi:hypothetical protein
VALALQADGWYLRSDLIWAKGISFCDTYSGSCMPESVRDRPTKAHEYVFLLSKKPRYFYDADAVREESSTPWHGVGGYREGNIDNNWGPSEYRNDERERAGRNLRTVWAINPGSFPEAHFATFSPALVEPMIRASTSERGVCPACGSPWERVTEKSTEYSPVEATTEKGDARASGTGYYRPNCKETGGVGGNTTTKTIAWQPTCTCPPADPIPATVLDIFSGAGTTLLVADRLGRDGIGIDQSEEYIQMSYDRLVGDAPMFADVRIVEAEAVPT